MNNNLKHTIYSSSDCLSEKMLFDYIDNKLNQKERHIVEKHLLDCEMCSDALEGLELTKDRNRIALIREAVNKRIQFLDSARNDKDRAVVVKFNYKMAFSIAAAIALLVVGVFFFNQINLKESAISSDMAELKETESPPPPPADNTENIAAKTTAADTGKESTEAIDEAEKLAPSKIIDQEIAMAEEEQKPGFYKNKEGLAENRNQETVAPAENSGNGIAAFDATITPKDDRANNQLETVSIPKTSVPEREKDAKLDDTKKAEEKTITGATGGTYTWSTPEQNQKQKNTADNSTVSGEQIELAKKADKGGKYRSEGKPIEEKSKAKKAQVTTKETRSDTKDGDGNFGGVVGYEPQSVSQDKAKAADEDSDELKSEVVTNTSISQTVTDSVEHVFSVVEQMPEYPGGNDSLMKFLHKNFNFKQPVDKSNTITTKIWVQFIVGKDGVVRDPKIVKGINPELDKEAIRVVKMMPKWKPGKQNGKAVSTTFNLPIQLEFK